MIPRISVHKSVWTTKGYLRASAPFSSTSSADKTAIRLSGTPPARDPVSPPLEEDVAATSPSIRSPPARTSKPFAFDWFLHLQSVISRKDASKMTEGMKHDRFSRVLNFCRANPSANLAAHDTSYIRKTLGDLIYHRPPTSDPTWTPVADILTKDLLKRKILSSSGLHYEKQISRMFTSINMFCSPDVAALMRQKLASELLENPEAVTPQLVVSLCKDVRLDVLTRDNVLTDAFAHVENGWDQVELEDLGFCLSRLMTLHARDRNIDKLVNKLYRATLEGLATKQPDPATATQLLCRLVVARAVYTSKRRPGSEILPVTPALESIRSKIPLTFKADSPSSVTIALQALNQGTRILLPETGTGAPLKEESRQFVEALSVEALKLLKSSPSLKAAVEMHVPLRLMNKTIGVPSFAVLTDATEAMLDVALKTSPVKLELSTATPLGYEVRTVIENISMPRAPVLQKFDQYIHTVLVPSLIATDGSVRLERLSLLRHLFSLVSVEDLNTIVKATIVTLSQCDAAILMNASPESISVAAIIVVDKARGEGNPNYSKARETLLEVMPAALRTIMLDSSPSRYYQVKLLVKAATRLGRSDIFRPLLPELEQAVKGMDVPNGLRLAEVIGISNDEVANVLISKLKKITSLQGKISILGRLCPIMLARAESLSPGEVSSVASNNRFVLNRLTQQVLQVYRECALPDVMSAMTELSPDQLGMVTVVGALIGFKDLRDSGVQELVRRGAQGKAVKISLGLNCIVLTLAQSSSLSDSFVRDLETALQRPDFRDAVPSTNLLTLSSMLSDEKTRQTIQAEALKRITQELSEKPSSAFELLSHTFPSRPVSSVADSKSSENNERLARLEQMSEQEKVNFRGALRSIAKEAVRQLQLADESGKELSLEALIQSLVTVRALRSSKIKIEPASLENELVGRLAKALAKQAIFLDLSECVRVASVLESLDMVESKPALEIIKKELWSRSDGWDIISLFESLRLFEDIEIRKRLVARILEDYSSRTVSSKEIVKITRALIRTRGKLPRNNELAELLATYATTSEGLDVNVLSRVAKVISQNRVKERLLGNSDSSFQSLSQNTSLFLSVFADKLVQGGNSGPQAFEALSAMVGLRFYSRPDALIACLKDLAESIETDNKPTMTLMDLLLEEDLVKVIKSNPTAAALARKIAETIEGRAVGPSSTKAYSSEDIKQISKLVQRYND